MPPVVGRSLRMPSPGADSGRAHSSRSGSSLTRGRSFRAGSDGEGIDGSTFGQELGPVAVWVEPPLHTHIHTHTNTYSIYAQTTTPKTPHGSSPPYTNWLHRAWNPVALRLAHTQKPSYLAARSRMHWSRNWLYTVAHVPSLSLSGALLRRARGYSDGVVGGPDEPLPTDSARAEEPSHGRPPGHHHRHRGEDREGAGEGEGRAEGTSTRSGSPLSGDDDSGDVLGSGSDSDLWSSDEERDMGESAGCFLNLNVL